MSVVVRHSPLGPEGLPLPPLDERYNLFSAIVSSTQDGSMPQHVTFMGPGLELVLQARPVEPSQARSNATVEYVLSIDYHGITKLRRFLGPGRQHIDLNGSRDMIFSYQQERAAVRVRLRFQVPESAPQAFRSMEFTIASLSPRPPEVAPYTVSVSSPDHLSALPVPTSNYGHFSSFQSTRTGTGTAFSPERSDMHQPHMASVHSRPPPSPLGDARLAAPHYYAMERHGSIQHPFRMLSPSLALSQSFHPDRPPVSPLHFARHQGTTNVSAVSATPTTSMMLPPPAPRAALDFVSPATPLSGPSRTNTAGTALSMERAASLSQLEHYRSMVPTRRTIPFAKPVDKPPKLPEPAQPKKPTPPQKTGQRADRKPAQKADNKADNKAQTQKPAQKPALVRETDLPSRAGTASPPDPPRLPTTDEITLPASPAKAQPELVADSDGRCGSCVDRGLSCRRSRNSNRCVPCIVKHVWCSLATVGQIEDVAHVDTTRSGQGTLKSYKDGHSADTENKTRKKPSGTKTATGVAENEQTQSSTQQWSPRPSGQVDTQAGVRTRAGARRDAAKLVSTVAVAKVQKETMPALGTDRKSAATKLAATSARSKKSSASTARTLPKPKMPAGGRQSQQNHARVSLKNGKQTATALEAASKKRKRPGRVVISSDEEEQNDGDDDEISKKRKKQEQVPRPVKSTTSTKAAQKSRGDRGIAPRGAGNQGKADPTTRKKPTATKDCSKDPPPKPPRPTKTAHPSAPTLPSSRNSTTTTTTESLPAPTPNLDSQSIAPVRPPPTHALPLPLPLPLDEGLERILWQAAMPPPAPVPRESVRARVWNYVRMQSAVMDFVGRSRVRGGGRCLM